MMEQDVQESITLLNRTPAVLDGLLRGLGEQWTMATEGGKTWSAFDVVAHLVQAERMDWIPRIRSVIEFGDSKVFEPFDRGGHERESAGKSLGQLLHEFARIRAANIEELRGLNLLTEDMQRKGRHPALGMVKLSELLATWAVHDLTHLHQISRVLAHQYREAVGPWSKYLGVLRCEGHSASA